MSWETQIACRLFPKEQKFMARRKLRTALWVLVVGIVASALVFGLMVISQHQH